MPLCKWYTFWMAPFLICYFIVILFYIERKWLLMRNLTTILPFVSNCLEHFSASILLLKVSKYWKIVELRKISINLKNCKSFHETQTASRFKKIIQPLPTPYTSTSGHVFVANIFSGRFTEIYKHLLSKCFKKVVLGRQEMVQCKCFFWHQTETCLLENL